MGQLENMRIFAAIVESGNISRASEHLGLAKSAVSKRLFELEEQLGVTLINRTTRKSSLTEAGHIYFERCRQLLEEVDELDGLVVSEQTRLKGVLKIAVPLSFGISHLLPALEQFMNDHEELKLNIDFADRSVDIVEEGFDLAIRIAHLSDSTLHARKITQINHVICASPEYLKKYGTPHTPDDLKHHRLLKYSRSSLSGIEMFDRDGKKITVPIESRCIANNGEALKVMAISGIGITYLPKFILAQSIDYGLLVPIMSDFELPAMNAYAVYPQSHHLPRRTRLFIDYICDYFE
ncbi:LysR family transcriptional regulator [Veronia nyctiphanis]|uniref:LysR family transcriptional regulator n=1 Tax=Veronia nyctiphanis TaxID=1278244 RepID=A0A4Q0YTD1_9GAMM|nr:LysR family transcriptional regulator [Veronia nyctiphanis]RXJ73975.1 LysR family transcriptional regulator [Veronia nyctiphanis]